MFADGSDNIICDGARSDSLIEIIMLTELSIKTWNFSISLKWIVRAFICNSIVTLMGSKSRTSKFAEY